MSEEGEVLMGTLRYQRETAAERRRAQEAEARGSERAKKQQTVAEIAERIRTQQAELEGLERELALDESAGLRANARQAEQRSQTSNLRRVDQPAQGRPACAAQGGEMSNAGREVHFRLRLYVAGPGDYTNRARQNLAAFADTAGFAYDLELVGLCHEPKKAAVDAVVVTPTLVKLSPSPRAMVIGELSDVRKLAAAPGVSPP